MRTIVWSQLRSLALVLIGQWVLAGAASAQPLVWDAVLKEHKAKLGETNANFTFAVTNVSSEEVLVRQVHTSCGCTQAKLPTALPWKIAPHSGGLIEVGVDLRGKRGVLQKVVSVDASSGMSLLSIRVDIPEPPMDRGRNMQIASADRQAVFRGDCASCHLIPALGKRGEPLYNAACAICHEGEHRASMVPDLKALKKPTDAVYWKTWVKQGRAGSLMPAFGAADGGFLDDEQIKSLVEFLGQRFPSKAAEFDLGNPFSESPPVPLP